MVEVTDTHFIKSGLKRLDDATADDLRTAYKTCANIVRRNAGNFTYAFKLLSGHKRRGIDALYSFCRIGDDLTDDESSDDSVLKSYLIKKYTNKLDQAYAGYYTDDVTLALSDSIRRYGFERAHFNALIAGFEMDLTTRRYETFDDLKLYCYRVASAVGLLCLKIFGCDYPQTRLYAEYLGIALQLTNILRDIGEDYSRGRIYLPMKDLHSFGLNTSKLLTADYTDRLQQLIVYEAKQALGFYLLAELNLPGQFKSQLIVPRIMSAIYRRILEIIIRDKNPNIRVSLPHWEKLKIAFRTVLS